MKIESFAFGSLRIGGKTYDHDVVIDRGKILKRSKKASKPLRDEYGHTPLSAREEIPWNCRRLVIGTGAYGRLPVVDELAREAIARNVELVVLPTAHAIELVNENDVQTNAILHVTC